MDLPFNVRVYDPEHFILPATFEVRDTLLIDPPKTRITVIDKGDRYLYVSRPKRKRMLVLIGNQYKCEVYQKRGFACGWKPSFYHKPYVNVDVYVAFSDIEFVNSLSVIVKRFAILKHYKFFTDKENHLHYTGDVNTYLQLSNHLKMYAI